MFRPDVSELQSATPPFASVTMDVTASDRATEDDLGLRWRAACEELKAEGAPEDVVDLLGDRVLNPTGLGGEHTRVVVADSERVVLDRVVPGRPARPERPETGYGPVPVLTGLLRAASRFVPHAVVRIDHAGADIEYVTSLDGRSEEEQVEGGHNELHKVPSGGMSTRRIESRVEDSWARNAEAVAKELDALCRRHDLEVVAVAGEDDSWGALQHSVAGHVAERLVRLDSGGRAAGTSEEAEAEALREALDAHRAAERARLLDEFNEQSTRQQRGVEGLGDVVDALRRGQVEHVLLRDDPTSTLTLWAGEEPLQLGMTEEEARDAGAQKPVEVRADAALAQAVLGSGADLVLVEDADVELVDGIGALLRWSDEATAHDRAPSMPGHGEGPGFTENPE